MARTDSADVLRRALSDLSDETVHGAADAFIRGMLHAVADDLADRLMDGIVAHLSTLADSVGADPEPVAPTPPPKQHHTQDVEKRTCEVCGRVGTRRFVPVAHYEDNRWKCSPTAAACIGNKDAAEAAASEPVSLPPGVEHGKYGTYDRYGCRCADCRRAHAVYTRELKARTKAAAKEAVTLTPPSDIPANKFPANVTPGVTARCQDCTRTWTLTGRVLTMAAESHELKHAHIVDVLDGDK